MSQATFELKAEARSDVGKGASRRLRRLHDKLPAIVYGGDEAPVNIVLDHKPLMHALEHEAFFSHILTLYVDGKAEKVILRDLQRHPFKRQVLHADFQRVKASEAITMHVPLHFLNEADAPGVKEGGVVTHNMVETEVRCLPAKLPEFLAIDVSNVELDQVLHLSDLPVPDGVEITTLQLGEDHDHPIFSIHTPKRPVEPEDEAETADEDAPAEGEAAEGNAKPEEAGDKS